MSVLNDIESLIERFIYWLRHLVKSNALNFDGLGAPATITIATTASLTEAIGTAVPITGTIVDSANNPLPNVSIYAFNNGTMVGTAAAATSNASGTFAFNFTITATGPNVLTVSNNTSGT